MRDEDEKPTQGRTTAQRGEPQRETPFGTGIPLGRWAGVRIWAHWSVLIALILFTYLIATVDLPGMQPGLSPTTYWIAGVITSAAFFVSLLAHELAHALAARHYSLRVRRITLWMLGGLTELEGESRTPRADAVVAAAGPLTSLALGLAFSGAAWLLGGGGLAATALAWLGGLNVLLAIFNLLPGSPLDGGRLLRALLWWRGHDRGRAAEQAASAGRVLGTILIGLGLLELLLGDLAGPWLALIGLFVITGAASEGYAVRAERLHGLTVRDAMTPTDQVAPDWATVEQLVSSLSPGASRQPLFPLVDIGGGFTGVVTLADLERIPSERRATTRLSQLGARSGRLLTVTPSDDLAPLLLTLHLRGGIAIVVHEGRPIGVITEGDLAHLAQLSAARERPMA